MGPTSIEIDLVKNSSICNSIIMPKDSGEH